MATVDKYKIKIEVDGKEKIIDVQDEVDNLSQKITDFAKVGAAAFGVLAVSAARMADQIVDMSDAFGISASKLYQMSLAAEAAGGSFDDIEGIMLRFSNAVDGAVEGNDKLRDSFTQLGISRDELATLDDEQLFQKVVSGLGAMEDGAQKTALAIELLGKRGASLNLEEFARLTSAPGDASIDKLFTNAADAIGTLEVAFRNLQLAALQAINPILEAIGEFDFSVEDAQKLLQKTGAVIAAAFAIGGVVAFTKAIGVLNAILRTTATTSAVIAALSGPKGWGMLVAGAAAGAGAYVMLGNAIEGATDAQINLNDSMDAAQLQQYNELIAKQADLEERISNARGRGAVARRQQLNEELALVKAQIDQLSRPFVGPRQPTGAITTTADPLRDLQLTQSERLAASARRTTEQMIKQNEQANSLRTTINQVANLEQNRARLLIANNQAYADKVLAIFDLEQQIQVEREKGEQINRAVIDQLEQQKRIIEQQFNETERLNQEEFDRLNSTRLQNEALRDQLSFVNQVFNGIQETARINMMMYEAAGMNTRAREKEAKLNLEELRTIEERSRLELELNALSGQDADERRAAIQRLMAEEETRHVTNINNINAEQIAIDTLNNSRIAGVTSAMEQISEGFTPYQMAQDAVLMTWNNIGNAIDDVARGGKASFGDMARSIIADLGSMIAKAMIFKAIQTAFGFGSLGISLPGLAKGGPAQAGQPYIVGEKGPELFVPKNAGTVIPNNKLGAQSQAAPMQQSQPAQVTNIVNNISAIDAKGVAALFYENRRALLGTMNVAQKEMPYGTMG